MTTYLDPIGLDIGYGYTKAASATQTIIFPSVVGSADHSQFRTSNGSGDLFLSLGGREYAIGDTAIKFSRFYQRLESRRWVESSEWMALAYAALHQCDIVGPLRVVAGLPMSYFDDKEIVKQRLTGKHIIDVSNGHGSASVIADVQRVDVVPQPFGSLFRMVFKPNGNIVEQYAFLLSGRVGIIDFGSNHTNFLEVVGGDQVDAGSTAIDMGGWDLCRAAQDYLLKKAPGAEFRDHVLAKAIEQGYYRYYGEDISLGDAVRPMVQDLAAQAEATATQLWGSSSDLDAILITGGLAEVVADDIREFFKQHKNVIVVSNPQMANARGFYSYGKFLNQVR